MKTTKKKIAIISGFLLLAIIGTMLLLVGGYVAYVAVQYSRVEDNFTLQITNQQTNTISLDTAYTATTYNIGFGAYTPEFSFFMDSGAFLDGKKVSGKYSKAFSKEVVNANSYGAIDFVNSTSADFMLFQEVDVKATRSHNVNQYDLIMNRLGKGYSYSIAENFKSAYLLYPFSDPHGKTNAGIVTASKFKSTISTRHQFPVDTSFPTKFFDLDRCFSSTRYPLENGKEFVLVNLHMSAYDEGGLIRQQQLAKLNEFLKVEADKGNYVLAGGDFNHDIADSKTLFPTTQSVPEWIYQLKNADLATSYSFVANTNCATVRSTDMAYTQGVNYTAVIDGFIASSNIEIIRVENLDNNFLFSDHNPVKLKFKLIA